MAAAFAACLALAGLAGCDVERRKSDAELGLNPQQAAGRKIYDNYCDRCHRPDSTKGKKGPGLKGVFQHQYLPQTGLPANDDRVTDIIRNGRPDMPGYSQVHERARHAGLAGLSAHAVRARSGSSVRSSFSSWDNLRVKTAAPSELFRKLPSVDDVMRGSAVGSLAAGYGHDSVVDAARVVLARLRQEIASGLLDADALELALSGLAGAVENQLRQALGYSLRPVINATGVILHTNLGRAPLGDAAIEHIRETAASYSNLEFDLESALVASGTCTSTDCFASCLVMNAYDRVSDEGRWDSPRDSRGGCPHTSRCLDHRGQQQCGCRAAGAEHLG